MAFYDYLPQDPSGDFFAALKALRKSVGEEQDNAEAYRALVQPPAAPPRPVGYTGSPIPGPDEREEQRLRGQAMQEQRNARQAFSAGFGG